MKCGMDLLVSRCEQVAGVFRHVDLIAALREQFLTYTENKMPISST